MTTKTIEQSISPIFRPPLGTTKHQILISPGHSTPGWITHIATLLSDPIRDEYANAAFANPQNERTLCWLHTASPLLNLCKSFGRVLPPRTWSAEDEANSAEEQGDFGEGILERIVDVEGVFWRS